MIPAAVFLAVFALVVGVYWVFVVYPEQKAQTAVRRRLRIDGRIAAFQKGLLKEAQRLSHVAPLERALARAGGAAGRLQRLIDESGLRVTVGTMLLACGCTMLLAYEGLRWLTHQPWLAALVAAITSMVPIAGLQRARDRRMRQFEELFPEAIDLIARALRSGQAFTTGLAMVADEVPAPVGAEFKLLYEQQEYGLPLPAALKGFAERIPVLDARFFVTAVLTQRETGGNLAEVLDNLASVIRERFRVKRQVRVLSAHGRLTGWILAALPPVLAGAMFVINPAHPKILLHDPLGIQMIVGALVLQVIGTLVIRKIIDIEY